MNGGREGKVLNEAYFKHLLAGSAAWPGATRTSTLPSRDWPRPPPFGPWPVRRRRPAGMSNSCRWKTPDPKCLPSSSGKAGCSVTIADRLVQKLRVLLDELALDLAAAEGNASEVAQGLGGAGEAA